MLSGNVTVSKKSRVMILPNLQLIWAEMKDVTVQEGLAMLIVKRLCGNEIELGRVQEI